ncbi:MAG: hypothetical protein GXO33_04260 [Epsilonproteobacteria bacterium]|nr:hypothetical protein [Campylobacterota bacterium]
MLETIVKEFGLKKVSERTKISERNLEKLLNREFGSLPRPQAFGFVAIIEREFGADLSAMREEMKQFYQNRPAQTGEPIFSREDLPAARRKSGGAGWLIGLVLLVFAGGGYYAYENFFHGGQAGEARRQAPVETERNVTTVVAGEAVQKPATAEDADKSDQSVEAAPAEGKGDDGETVEAAPEAKVAARPQPEEPEPYVPLDPVIVEPTVKLWIGIIDLKSRKRRVKIVKRPFEIDSHGRKLLLTGHGRFEISDGEGNIIKLNDAKKHYFLIDNGVLQEIDAAAFRRYNGGKGW